jgi:cytochrome c oxidase subunit 2
MKRLFSPKGIALVLLATLLAGCTGATDFVSNSASSISDQESSLFRLLLIMAGIVFVIVEGGIIYAVVRYRRHHNDTVEPRQVYAHVPLEVIWTAIPFVLVGILFVSMLNTMNAVAAPQPTAADIKVTVVGHRWWWEFNYPDLGITTANEMVIPANATVRLTLKSVDVVHSFWVPQLAGKTDVVPGQVNTMWVMARQPGVYDGQCAEFCGIEHALMRFKVVSLDKAGFDAWVANQKLGAPAPQTDFQNQGQKLVAEGACGGCHTINGTTAKGIVGPNLTHLFSRSTFAGGSYVLNDANLTSWLKDTQSLKPGNLMTYHVPDAQIPAVLAYLKTLK